MRTFSVSVTISAACMATSLLIAASAPAPAPTPAWNPRAAAAYLDGRADWWLAWPNAARDHDTACVSCHTALPYALGRPAPVTASDIRAVERAMTPLHAVGAVTVDRRASVRRDGPHTVRLRAIDAAGNVSAPAAVSFTNGDYRHAPDWYRQFLYDAERERGQRASHGGVEAQRGEPEADPSAGKISVISPIARALIGKSKGATVAVETPGGAKAYRVRQVEWFENSRKGRERA